MYTDMWSEEYQCAWLDMYHRVFDRVSAVVGEQVWNFADFATSQGILRVGGNKKDLHPRPQTEVGGFSAAKRWTGMNFGENRSREANNESTTLRRTIVGYSLGDVANNFAFAMGALFLLSYYTDVAGVGAAAAGTMLLLVRVFDAFADVFAGRVVDSVNTRWGKFRPFYSLVLRR